VEFSGGRPFRRATYLPVGSLTVLLGANGAGKSTTLRILNHTLPALGFASPETEIDETKVTCNFFVEVSDAQLEVLATDAIAAFEAADTADSFGDVDAAWHPTTDFTLIAGPDAVDRWASSVEAAVEDETLAEMVKHLRGSRIVKVVPDGPRGPFHLTWCVEADDGAERTLSGYIPLVALGSTGRSMVPTAVSVPRPLEELRSELRNAVLAMLVHLRWGERDRWAQEHGVAMVEPAARRDTRAWLEDPDVASAEISNDAKAICALISRLASTLTPGFVSDAHAIRVAIEPIYRWERGGPQLLLELIAPSGDLYPLSRAADGHRVWLQLGLLEAMAVLRRYADVLDFLLDRALVDLPVSMSVSDSGSPAAERYRAAVDLLRAFAVVEDASVSRFLGLRESGYRLYLIDEPEQHLHPRVQRTAAQWLVRSGTAGASQALVVTHSPHYLRIPGDVAFAYVRSEAADGAPQRSTISPLTPELLAASDEIAGEMGFDRGELLSSVAAFVFVEGQADKLFLDAVAGQRLHHAGVALVPIHGAVDAEKKGIVDSEIVLSWTAARLAILLDNLLEDEWSALQADPDYCAEQARKAKKTELRAMARVLVRAEEVGRTITPLGIAGDDIFDLIDNDVVRDRFPTFPGHAEARAAWQAASAVEHINWKTFYRDQYGIEVEPPLFGELGAEMARRSVMPSEVSLLLDRMCDLTTGT
jgi:hypothetical protein